MEAAFKHDELRYVIQWYRTGVFVRMATKGERVEKIKGVDQYQNAWIGEGKVNGNQIVEVINKVIVGPQIESR